MRRARTRSTPLPQGPDAPPVPSGAVELDTRYGTFWFDDGDTRLTPWIREHGTWEADVVRLLERTLQPGMRVVDVGANVGFHTVLASRLVGEQGRVYAVEPVPWTVQLLRANLWRHGCTNVEVFPLGAADRRAEARLAIPADARSGASLALYVNQGEVVPVAPVDALVEEGSVSLMKVDVEGLEHRVLAGARAIVERSPDLLVVVEFRPRTDSNGLSPEDTLARYEAMGFELCRLRRDGRPEPAARRELLEHFDAEVVNIVLRRR